MKKAIYSGMVILLLMVVIAFTGNGNYSVVNKSGFNVTSISISPSGDAGSSVTYSRSLAIDQSISIEFNASQDVCNYTVQFTDDRGIVHVMDNVELCGSDAIVLESSSEVEAPQIFVVPGR